MYRQKKREAVWVREIPRLGYRRIYLEPIHLMLAQPVTNVEPAAAARRKCGARPSFAVRMERSPGRWLAIFSLVYLIAEICQNSRRGFWFDEFITSYLADLPSISRIWPLIAQGIELNPPLPFWIAWITRHLFGGGEVLLRLPAVIGFWVMCLCLYFFVRRRSDALHGFLALLFPLFTYTAWNANEARGYGLLLGFSGLALLSWQLAADGVQRRLALLGLAVGIAGAVSSHYYAVYVAGALALGEAVRSVDRRRVDFAIWVAIAAGLSLLLVYLPLIRSATPALRTFWTPPEPVYLADSYAGLLGPTTIVIFLFLAIAIGAAGLDRGRWQTATLLRHELVTVLTLFAMPLALYLSTFFVPAGFYIRYVQPVVLGAAVLLALFVYRIAGANQRFRNLWVTLLLWFTLFPWTIWQVAKVLLMPISGKVFLQTLDISQQPSLPLVIDGDNDFLVCQYYGPPELRARTFTLADTSSSIKYVGGDTALRSLLLVQTFRDLHVVEYHEFLRAHRQFLLARAQGASWIVQKLLADGAQIQLVQVNKDLGTFAKDRLLYRVSAVTAAAQ